MPTTWIVSGDAARARILQVTGRNQLEEVEHFSNPEGRMHDRDLATDGQPRFNGASGGPASDREEMGRAEIEAAKFSKQIGRYLDQARMKNLYDRLYLVAPPRFLGMMRKELGKEVEKLVRDDLDEALSRKVREGAPDSGRAP
jgi:protein required for attachment to host cells